MEMQNVEIDCTLAHFINHQHVMRNDVAHRNIKPERAITTGGQFGGSN